MKVRAGFLQYMAENSGHVEVELRDSPDEALAIEAMEAARAALYRIPHPEEPEDPLPSVVSEVVMGSR